MFCFWLIFVFSVSVIVRCYSFLWSISERGNVSYFGSLNIGASTLKWGFHLLIYKRHTFYLKWPEYSIRFWVPGCWPFTTSLSLTWITSLNSKSLSFNLRSLNTSLSTRWMFVHCHMEICIFLCHFDWIISDRIIYCISRLRKWIKHCRMYLLIHI